MKNKIIDIRKFGYRLVLQIRFGRLATRLGGKNYHKAWTVSSK